MKVGKGISLLLAFGCILVGCTHQEATKTPSPIRSVQTLQFGVSANLDKEFLEQAALFAGSVDRISRGRLHVEVVEVDGESLPDAQYDFAYLRNDQAAQLEPILATLSLPFLYDDATQLSLSLNSPEIKKVVETYLEGQMFPLAALSSGSALLLSVKSAGKNDMGMPVYFQELGMALHEEPPETAMAFRALGARVALFSQESLTSLLEQEVMVLPSNSGQRGTAVINAVEATREQVLSMPINSDVLYVIETMHNLSPIWMVAKADTWGNLSKWEQAVVQEATAALTSGFEENYNRYIAAWEKEAGKKGVTMVKPERQAIAVSVYNFGGGTSYFELPNYFDKRLFDMVQNFN